MGDDDLDLLHVSRHRGMTIDVTGRIACEFVQPGLTSGPVLAILFRTSLLTCHLLMAPTVP
jgi:hypothetical protein